MAEPLQEESRSCRDNSAATAQTCTLSTTPSPTATDDSLKQSNVKVPEKKIFDIRTGNRCSACGNRSGYDLTNGIKRSYHSFPLTNPARMAQWMEAIPRKRWTPTANNRICSDHFKGGKRSNVEGTDGYIPTIFTTGKQPWEDMVPNPGTLSNTGAEVINKTTSIMIESKPFGSPHNVNTDKPVFSYVEVQSGTSPSSNVASGVVSEITNKERTTWLVKLKSKNGHVSNLLGGSTGMTLDNLKLTPGGSTDSMTSNRQVCSDGLQTTCAASATVGTHESRKCESSKPKLNTTNNGDNHLAAGNNLPIFKQEYLCPVCLRLFENENALTVHRTDQHQDHENFACILCDGIQFATRSMLLQHNATNHCIEVVSTPRVPVSVCGIGQPQMCEDKMRIHAQITPVVCEKCGHRYPDVDALASHFSQKHKTTKREHESVQPESESAKWIHEPAKRECESSKSEHESAKQECESSKPKHESVKREHESTKREHDLAKWKHESVKREYKSPAKMEHVSSPKVEYESPAKRAHEYAKWQHDLNTMQETESPSSQEGEPNPLSRRVPKSGWKMLGQWKTGHWRGTGANKCHLCDYSSITKKAVDEHVYKYHNILKAGMTGHQCPRCTFKSLCRSKFMRHSMSHRDDEVEKPLSCDVCPRRFAKKEHLRRHMMRHNGEKRRFQCDKCDYSSHSSCSLRVHIQIIHEQKGGMPFQCSDCDYASNYKHNLVAHCRRKHNHP